MGAEPSMEIVDFRRLIIPQGGLDTVGTSKLADAVGSLAADGYLLVRVSARQKDTGSQRDPNVVTEAVVLHFQRPTA